MAAQRQGKTGSSLKNLFAKTSAKKQEPTCVGNDAMGEEDTNPVMKAFMEQLFGVLREDLATLRQERATTFKELKGEVA
ncbi:hypothetical protein NDU88_006911 [Pleurodeles waltl]|uniref:Uncharacterized protein n=1 Tax=Pleurodeles waltl TaxID=8319 RepID=A0AAV7LTB1_PLEWA|nr:hypothetical protein NDU88_006911 [Pleurodeles waltl]